MEPVPIARCTVRHELAQFQRDPARLAEPPRRSDSRHGPAHQGGGMRPGRDDLGEHPVARHDRGEAVEHAIALAQAVAGDDLSDPERHHLARPEYSLLHERGGGLRRMGRDRCLRLGARRGRGHRGGIDHHEESASQALVARSSSFAAGVPDRPAWAIRRKNP